MIRSVFLLGILILGGCDPYLTKGINNISKIPGGDSIFLAGPLVEGRLQINKDKYTSDSESQDLARVHTQNVLHKLLDTAPYVEFDNRDPINSWRIKSTIDSILILFAQNKYEHFSIHGKLRVPSEATLVLVPYLIWTRTTPDFESEKCGKVGYRDYANRNTCTWTRAEAFIFLFDAKNSDLIYYKRYVWMRDFPDSPFEEKVTQAFRNCFRGLLRDMKN